MKQPVFVFLLETGNENGKNHCCADPENCFNHSGYGVETSMAVNAVFRGEDFCYKCAYATHGRSPVCVIKVKKIT